VFAAILSSGIAALFTVKTSHILSSRIHRINYSKISIVVIGFVCFMAIYFSGGVGLLLLVTSSALGIFTIKVGVRRGILMGVLILPTILFFVA